MYWEWLKRFSVIRYICEKDNNLSMKTSSHLWNMVVLRFGAVLLLLVWGNFDAARMMGLIWGPYLGSLGTISLQDGCLATIHTLKKITTKKQTESVINDTTIMQ